MYPALPVRAGVGAYAGDGIEGVRVKTRRLTGGMEAKLANGIKLSWGTPVLVIADSRPASAEAELRDAIVARHRESGDSHSHWMSSPDVLEWPLTGADALKQKIVGAFQRAQARVNGGPGYEGRLNVRCWGAVLEAGHATPAQRHGQSAWTGVWRADGGSDNVDLVLNDPRPGAGLCQDPFALFGQPRRFPLRQDELVIFPSWVSHVVDAKAAQAPCVYVSFVLATLDLM